MEAVLDLYAQAYDAARPVVCFDELPYQMVAETREPLPAAPGKPARYDYEYRRMGTCNLFACFEPKAGRRQIRVTQRRTSGDFAEAMRWLIDEGYPEAETVRVVPDNLNTHTGAAGALWAGTKRLRLRKHDASCARWRSITRQSTDRWLNQGEIAWSVLTQQCLERRIGDIETLRREVGAWERERNAAKATVQWRFGGEKARVKLARLYPSYLLS